MLRDVWPLTSPVVRSDVVPGWACGPVPFIQIKSPGCPRQLSGGLSFRECLLVLVIGPSCWLSKLMRTTGGSGESPEDVAAWRREMRLRRRVPVNEIGGAVNCRALLSQSSQAAIYLDRVRVFSTGLQLRFEVISRPLPAPGPAHSRPIPPWMDSTRQGGILVGVKLGDGRMAINIDDDRRRKVSADDELVLARSGFSGSDESASVQYLLSPLPALQSLTVVVAWPKLGVPETAVVIDGEEITAEAHRLVTLWPVDDADWFGPSVAPVLPLDRSQ